MAVNFELLVLFMGVGLIKLHVLSLYALKGKGLVQMILIRYNLFVNVKDL